MSETAVEPQDDGLVLLSNDAMRARRRPFAILAVWAWESVLALIIAWPVAAIVRNAYGGHPRGDAQLWNPGSLELLDLLDHTERARAGVLGVVIVVTVLAAVLGLIPLGALLTSMGFATRLARGPRPQQAILGGVRAFVPMVLLLIVAFVAQAILAVFALLASETLSTELTTRLGEARAMQLGWLVLLLFALPIAVLGVIHDLGRAAVIRFEAKFFDALRIGLATFRGAKLHTFWSWAWRALASLVPIAIGSLVADRLGGRGGVALVGLFAVHQLVVVSRIALRASWLARAMRAVDGAGPRDAPRLQAEASER